jgi:hypothetical protein
MKIDTLSTYMPPGNSLLGRAKSFKVEISDLKRYFYIITLLLQ